MGSYERETDLSEKEVRGLIKQKLAGELTHLPYGFWRCKEGKEHAKIAIRYLIEEHLQWSLDEVPEKISTDTFLDHGLFRILVEFFDRSYFKALDFVYPGIFQPWDFSKGMMGIWDGKKGKARSKRAIKELIEKLEIPFEEIPEKIKHQTFKEHGLGGMLQILYGSSPYQAINAVYPDAFHPWEFHIKNYWKNESIKTARVATRWLIEERLALSKEQLDQARRIDFLKNGLGPMIKHFYDNSYHEALADAYPHYKKD
ncbi:MAG: hypothetical protein GF308_12535 [Candidatus Heimdallarchaeota archaeon]|nr:hypothetical protein [Candidatus Heimdallarchaeota archaeon]